MFAEEGGVLACGEADDFEAVGGVVLGVEGIEVFDDLDGLGADGAGGAEDDDASWHGDSVRARGHRICGEMRWPGRVYYSALGRRFSSLGLSFRRPAE